MNNDFTKSLDELDDLIEESWTLPIANNKYVIDGDKLKSIISDIKLNVPMEMRKSKEILENKEKLLRKSKEESDAMIERAKKTSEMMLLKARKSAETIMAKARTEAETILNEQQILEEARKKADDILEKARNDSKKMRKVSMSYVNGVLKDSHKALEKSLAAVEQAQKSYENDD